MLTLLLTLYIFSLSMSEQTTVNPKSSLVPPGHSKCDRWTKGNQSARERIEAGIVVPEWAPSFQLKPNAKIFAIGSCFARNIEKGLLQRLAQVTCVKPKSDILELRTNLLTGLLNKYNPISIHQELEWASGHNSFPDRGFIEFNGNYIDPCLREQARKGSLEFVQTRQEQLKQYFAQAFTADLVIITLGLTETWFDRTTRLALAETVSPVAMERTFSGQDIIVANMMSKSTLRSAAGAFTAAMEDVDYFPSYEAAMLSQPDLVWMQDRRNITDLLVNRVIGEFIVRYKL